MSEEKKKTENTSKKKEILKKIKGFLVIAMVAAISILGTLAYLSRKTDRVTNTFTATEDIKVKIIEPSFTPPPGGYQPDVEYPKDPRLANITGKDDANSSVKNDEWVIMRVDYRTFTDSEPTENEKGELVKTRTYTQVSYNDITHDQTLSDEALATDKAKGLINIINDLNNIPEDKNWIKVKPEWLDDELKAKVFGGTYNDTVYPAQKCDYFIYKKTIKSNTTVNSEDTAKANLGNDAVTAPLFDSVKIKSQEQLVHNGYRDENDTLAQLPGFTIDVLGGAIKNSGDKTIEIPNGVLDTSDLDNAGTAEDPNVSHTIVNELVKLLLNEDPVTSEVIAAN